MKLLMSFLAIGLICVDGSEKVSGNFMYFVCPSVVSRSEWNASAATEINFLEHPVKIAIICHTATPECSSLATCKRRVKRIQRYHQREKLWGDIAYNFLIGGDGNVYEGIGWNQSGRHTKNFNDISVGIAFIGNFTDALYRGHAPLHNVLCMNSIEECQLFSKSATKETIYVTGAKLQ